MRNSVSNGPNKMTISQIFPIVDQLKTYSKQVFYSDLSAGLTVGFMLVPQGMAYAMIAGLPPIYGLYASLVPLLMYALLGTSRQLAVGPVAMDSLLTASSVAVIAQAGTDQYIMMAIALAFFVGAIQFILGILKLGFLVNFLSKPVISGFTSAAALIIGFSQLKHLLGIKLESTNYIYEIIYQSFKQFDQINIYSLIIGILGIIVIKVLKRINRKIPAQLVLVAISIMISYLISLQAYNVFIVGDVPAGLPSFSIGHVSFDALNLLWPAAFTIAMISFMESYAVAKSIQTKHKNYRLVPNKELTALGVANMMGSLFQGFSVAGGFSRSAVNDQAGAKTSVASLITVVLIAFTLMFLTPIFYYLPKTILASIIMVAVFSLIDIKEAILLWKIDRKDFGLLLVSFFATIFLGIVQGIAVGVILSLILLIFNSSRPHIAVLGRIPNTDIFRNVERFENVINIENVLILRYDSGLYYHNIEYFRDFIDDRVFAKGSTIHSIILNSESINTIDSSSVSILKDMFINYKENDIKFVFTSVIGPVRDVMKKSGLFDLMGKDSFYLNISEAVKSVQNPTRDGPDSAEYTMQSN